MIAAFSFAIVYGWVSDIPVRDPGGVGAARETADSASPGRELRRAGERRRPTVTAGWL